MKGILSKRHFTVIIGNKEHGLYVSSTPSSAARKAVTKLCTANKSKKVEFHIREITQGSKKKTYGPFLGHMEKLKEPIELKGRVIKYKPVAKLIEKLGIKKGGMNRDGEQYSSLYHDFISNCLDHNILRKLEKTKIKYPFREEKKDISIDVDRLKREYNLGNSDIDKAKIDKLIKKLKIANINYLLRFKIITNENISENNFLLFKNLQKTHFKFTKNRQPLQKTHFKFTKNRQPLWKVVNKSKKIKELNDEEEKFIMSEYHKWKLEFILSQGRIYSHGRIYLKKIICDENGDIILEFSTDDLLNEKIKFKNTEIKYNTGYSFSNTQRQLQNYSSNFSRYSQNALYLNVALFNFGMTFCLKKLNDFILMFPPNSIVLSIGSGNGLFEYEYEEKYKKEILCIDPDPLSFLGKDFGLKKPFKDPINKRIDDFIATKNRSYMETNLFLLVINWAFPNDDDPYDLNAITLLKPAGFFVIFDEKPEGEGGIAGSLQFCEVISRETIVVIDGTTYYLIEKILLDINDEFDYNLSISFFRKKDDSMPLSSMPVSSSHLNNQNALLNDNITFECTIDININPNTKTRWTSKGAIRINYHGIPIRLLFSNLRFNFIDIYEKSYIMDSDHNRLCTVNDLKNYNDFDVPIKDINRLNEPNLILVAPTDFKIVIDKYAYPDMTNMRNIPKIKNQIEKMREEEHNPNFLEEVYSLLL